MAKGERLDRALVARGLVENRSRAQALIMAGEVRVDGEVARKAGQPVTDDARLEVAERLPYVSRGGVKLAGALDTFGVRPAGRICADVGASTGGFTDVLIQRDAARVYAIDVGYGQIAWKLREEPRVVVIERTNARTLERLPEPVSLVVMDASFISLTLLLPSIVGWLTAGGEVVTLVKPQFEAGPQEVGRGGIVRSAGTHRRVLERLAGEVERQGWTLRGLATSPLTGQRGNIEFFMWLDRAPGPGIELEPALRRVLDEAARLRAARRGTTAPNNKEEPH